MSLASDVLDRARNLLNDTLKLRWDDTQLLELATDGQRIIIRKKNNADTQSTIVKTEAPDLTALGDTLRITDQYLPTLAFYVAWMALEDDQDDGSANMAEKYKQNFAEQIQAEFL